MSEGCFMQDSAWHKPDEKPRTDKELLLYVETENGRGVVVGYYSKGECLEDVVETFGWNDFINFVNYDLDPGMVKVLAWQYRPELPDWATLKK